ncbi:hypothetical protein [Streptomyces zhihengii]|uniref:hypothetical protein n=1 Tax=Streptomyces zhihengii TaxID=1818004 RepID=UPI0033A63A6E
MKQLEVNPASSHDVTACGLNSVIFEVFGPNVTSWIAAEARGNPQAVPQPQRGAGLAETVGGFGLPVIARSPDAVRTSAGCASRGSLR